MFHTLDFSTLDNLAGRMGREDMLFLNFACEPPQFTFSPNLNFFILPRLAFILGRIELIFENPLFFTSFFRNFADKLLFTD